MFKKSSVSAKCLVAMMTVLVMLASLLPVMAQAEENRFTAEHLKAYYNFESLGVDVADQSGNGNDLTVKWGYAPTQVASDSSKGLGNGAKFSSQTALALTNGVYDQKDFLDNLDTYTLSMFYQNTDALATSGTTLFNNKFWGEEGVRVTVNKWPDAAATGQAEMYLTYRYVDTNGAVQDCNACVKFIPDANGAVDTSWHHIALVVDKPNHTIKFYFDGEKVYENSDMQELLVDCQRYSFALGGLYDTQYTGAYMPFDGALDEIRVYDFVATDSEAVKLSQNNLVPEVEEEDEIRIIEDNLEAYYDFETVGVNILDQSGNGNDLTVKWGYAPSSVVSDATLGLGRGGKFSSVSAITPVSTAYNQKDFLDNMDTYTLSMFYQNTAECAGGVLFNNKFWGEDGIRISVNKWADPAATGQAELYLDYSYVDTNGATQDFHSCVKFIPGAAEGGVDTAWHHIALTVDKTNHTIKLYFDGEKVYENSDMQALNSDCQRYTMAFGAMLDIQWPSVDRPYDGSLDEIRIYNFVANDTEAAMLSQNNIPGSEEEEDENRLSAETLKAYYNFDRAIMMGRDASGNGNDLVPGWGYSPIQVESDYGFGGKFAVQSAITPVGSVYNQKDFLDNMDTYTLSMFYQNTAECAGGVLFNNKFWGEDGIRISVNKWADPAATGQAELYLDYNYVDTNGVTQDFHSCVKFIPGAAEGGVDTAWHHIALTVDKTNHTIKLYFDGEKVYENSNMQALNSDCQRYSMAFGAMLDIQWPSVDRPYDGALDEIRIYDFAANSTEVALLSQNEVENDDIFVSGDTNNDGEANVLDVIELRNHTLGVAGLVNNALVNADVNNNGIVDIYDLLAIKKALFN